MRRADPAADLRLALLADIHGNLPALEAVVSDIRRRGIETIVNLGDCLSGPLLPAETAELLMAQDWPTVAGNHDRQIIRPGPGGHGASDVFAHDRLGASALAWLARLPPHRTLAPSLLLCHGTPVSDTTYLLDTLNLDGTVRAASQTEIAGRLVGEEVADDTVPSLIACGHMHLPRVVRTSAGQLIVNPGSVGLPAYADTHPVPHAMEAGSPDARYAIVERVAGAWQASLLAVPYDHHAMARLATRHDRPDWAQALRTGYMS